jgi:radical SAM superfamily enzyme YgiQ (UPF0313 family)
LIDAVVAAKPLVVGFSLIFQFFLPEYTELAEELRDAGVDAHFTIGGHYASLCPNEVLAAMPQLDSATRFEGELTLLDLVRVLERGGDWHEVAGLAWADDGTVQESAPRPLVDDLDTLPFPYRGGELEHVAGFNVAPLLASRGCARRCSFCSIQTFYRAAEGRIVRVRSAERVVDEMVALVHEHHVAIFLFQDDDFPLWGRYRRDWAPDLVRQIHDRRLTDEMIWKISCRAEYVEPELFSSLRDAGLYLVYMGLESGNEEGLSVLHKQISVETNLRALTTLKELGILFQYGFMLFDPSSTFESIRTNIGFLRTAVGDGSAGALFCRMLPYGGTPIRDQLAAEGRLRGDVVRPDYTFLDPRLDDFFPKLDAAVSYWVHGEGASFQLNSALHELEVLRRLVPGLHADGEYGSALHALTAHSNEGLFRFVEESSEAFERGDESMLEPTAVRETCRGIVGEMLGLRQGFVDANREVLKDALRARGALRSPVMTPQRY